MRYEAVLFDFEGTLVDFQWKLAEGEAALRSAFAGLGFAPAELAELNYSGMWNLALTHRERPIPEDELRFRTGPVYDHFDLDALSRWRLRPDSLPLLQALADLGIAAAVVSNIGSLALRQALENFSIEELLSLIVSRDDVKMMKPAPEGILYCLRSCQVEPTAALFVGDSVTDVRAARGAGTRVAIVPGGESSSEALRAEPPDFLLASLGDLTSLLTEN